MVQFSLGTLSVDLPSPQFDDTLNKKYRRTVRETQGKELLVFPEIGYSYLTQYKSLNYSFKYVDEPTKQHLIDFLDVTLGVPIHVVDYDSNNFLALITTPSAEVINTSRNDNEITLELEIIELSTPPLF